MRRVLPFILVASLAAAVVGASAQTSPTAPVAPATTATAPAPADAAAPANNDDIVSCRYEKTTGSLFSKRICHTQREWRQMTQDSRNLMDNLDSHSRSAAVWATVTKPLSHSFAVDFAIRRAEAFGPPEPF